MLIPPTHLSPFGCTVTPIHHLATAIPAQCHTCPFFHPLLSSPQHSVAPALFLAHSHLTLLFTTPPHSPPSTLGPHTLDTVTNCSRLQSALFTLASWCWPLNWLTRRIYHEGNGPHGVMYPTLTWKVVYGVHLCWYNARGSCKLWGRLSDLCTVQLRLKSRNSSNLYLYRAMKRQLGLSRRSTPCIFLIMFNI